MKLKQIRKKPATKKRVANLLKKLHTQEEQHKRKQMRTIKNFIESCKWGE